MAEIHKSATIAASVEKVFEIVDDPANFPKYVPNVHDVVDVRRSDGRIGDSFRVIYKVLGVTFDEKFTVTHFQRPNMIKSTFAGGMTGTFAWTFEPQQERSKLTIDVNYELAGGPLGKAVDSLMLQRVNEKTIEDTLKNLDRVAAEERSAIS
jgi:ribosome-associated toxin RatA of RatAB toxin-antitoxin module